MNHTTDLATVQTAVCRVGVDATVDQLAEAIGMLAALSAWVKERKAELDAGLLEYVTARGPVQIGDVRYWAGTKTVVKCIDRAAATDAILTHCEGSLEKFAGFLAADPYKVGAVRKELGQLPACFSEEVRADLKDGKPLKSLQAADMRFVNAG